MLLRPRAELATRPLHFLWIADCSGSMAADGKIQSLNFSIRDAIPHMQSAAQDNPNVEVLVRAIKFSHGAAWHLSVPTPVQQFRWEELIAGPVHQTPPGRSVDLVFLLDTSGSMQDEITAVKRNCTAFADRISRAGADVRLGLVGFDIGGHYAVPRGYQVHNLATYTIGVWPLAAPADFQDHIRLLTPGLFGGAGCYLANPDTVDIFPHVAQVFQGSAERQRVLVVISDEMGQTDGLGPIVRQLRASRITTYVLGVPGRGGAHQSLAEMTGGTFWDITATRGVPDFTRLLDNVASAIAHETSRKLANGALSLGTDMGAALRLAAAELQLPRLPEHALPSVVVLVSDGQPTDDFTGGLAALMAAPWGQQAVRLAIAIGRDADHAILQRFIGHRDHRPLQANNAEALAQHIRWASTAVLRTVFAPVRQTSGTVVQRTNVPLPTPNAPTPPNGTNVW